jgi:hypothetical protein
VSGEWRALSGREIAERRIAAGYTDEEVVESFGDGSLVWSEGEVVYLSEAPTRRRLMAEVRALRSLAETPSAGRPKTVPDVEAAMRRAITEMDRAQTKMTWANVALRIRDNLGLETYDESTLRKNAKTEQLPPPWDRFWRRSG